MGLVCLKSLKQRVEPLRTARKGTWRAVQQSRKGLNREFATNVPGPQINNTVDSRPAEIASEPKSRSCVRTTRPAR